MAEDFDLESLVHVEQTFYETGFKDGYAHGRIHGLIEGRALGREKGYEMWEELGFYEGFASTWKTFLEQRHRLRSRTASEDERLLGNINRLLELIDQFPKINPSSTDNDTGSNTPAVDISQLLSRIRSRYKVLCSSLGVRPTLRVGNSAQNTTASTDNGDAEMDTSEDGAARETRPRVWPVLSQLDPSVTNRDLSY